MVEEWLWSKGGCGRGVVVVEEGELWWRRRGYSEGGVVVVEEGWLWWRSDCGGVRVAVLEDWLWWSRESCLEEGVVEVEEGVVVVEEEWHEQGGDGRGKLEGVCKMEREAQTLLLEGRE